MSSFIAFLGEIFLIFSEWSFYKKKKKRRAYEKANGLPKKRMISPLTTAFAVVPGIILVVSFLFYSFINPIKQKRDTKDTFRALSYLLHQDKIETGSYPDDILELSRRNPTYGDLTKDAWKREIIYQKTDEGQDYILLSKGIDGVLQTDDDIKLTSQE